MNFGDGQSSSITSPSHTYASAGSYSVTLTATDAEGLEDRTTQTVTVENPGTGCAGVSVWSSTTLNEVGDSVSYNGNKYDAIWWSQAAQPDIFSNVWTDLGVCD